MAIIPRWRSYKEKFYRESSRECLNWRFYEGGALIKVADSAISTVFGLLSCFFFCTAQDFGVCIYFLFLC